jgi:hypothetical protein
MNLFNFFKKEKYLVDPADGVARMWEDDFCQIEILHRDNLTFLSKQLQIAQAFGEEHQTATGFTDIMAREENPVLTIDIELRADFLEQNLLSLKLPKYLKIQIDDGPILISDNSKTKAYGFRNFIIFFETEGEFVKNIWVTAKQIISKTELYTIIQALYNLGEGTFLILVDWNSNELVDLSDMRQIRRYLNNIK